MKSPKQDPKIMAITIFGQRWFQKLSGNTYHTVRVGVLCSKGNIKDMVSSVTYGCGKAYVQTGLDLLKSHCIVIPKNLAILIDAVDVPRKKDLKF